MPPRSLLAATLLLASGCDTPCGELRAHAESCGTSVSTPVDERASVCTATRKQVGPERFDAFGTCVVAASCDDNTSIDGCTQQHIPDANSSACLKYTLWASACALEPAGTDNNCGDTEASLSGATFTDWVACITAGGCPTQGDTRYDRCKDEVLPPQATQIVDACVIVEDWTAACAGTDSYLPIEETPATVCLAQADMFTSESYYAYAVCLNDVACDDEEGRIECILQLRFVDVSGIEPTCEELIAFGDGCNAPLGGDDVDVCVATFVRFTPESFVAYVECLEQQPCDDPDTWLPCTALLELL